MHTAIQQSLHSPVILDATVSDSMGIEISHYTWVTKNVCFLEFVNCGFKLVLPISIQESCIGLLPLNVQTQMGQVSEPTCVNLKQQRFPSLALWRPTSFFLWHFCWEECGKTNHTAAAWTGAILATLIAFKRQRHRVPHQRRTATPRTCRSVPKRRM